MMTLRAFLFQRQEGLCYLGATPPCKARGRQMRLDGKVKAGRATWEHVRPRSKQERSRHSAPLYLLACQHCNSAKSDRDPTQAELDLALAIQIEWRAYLWNNTKPRNRRRMLARLLKVELEPDNADARKRLPDAQHMPPPDVIELVRRAARNEIELGDLARPYLNQAQLEADFKRKREALGLDALGNADQRHQAIRRLKSAAAASMGR